MFLEINSASAIKHWTMKGESTKVGRVYFAFPDETVPIELRVSPTLFQAAIENELRHSALSFSTAKRRRDLTIEWVEPFSCTVAEIVGKDVLMKVTASETYTPHD